MNEFLLTLTNTLGGRGMSVPEMARRSGYDPLLFESIATGKSRQIPVDFFVRNGDVLSLAGAEKEAPMWAWAFSG